MTESKAEFINAKSELIFKESLQEVVTTQASNGWTLVHTSLGRTTHEFSAILTFHKAQ